ncbi:MAG: aldo/keto reductase [Rhizobiales bacterium]|nr:aldo/keto reductase [Hyphomicrobiales bacterium]MBO6699975.1 aldo/keto reductase [Hyphomicrobiales bacterium]MBO6737860.1 aldo/keto reductase [Hyphomicrobiales bacterium]MBO6913083.1 aldo/keto reductase [Hyphomicrobiales bacterium]MBO6957241.1 aldo/keto reductase [Hyphomicrobiales bacterium]
MTTIPSLSLLDGRSIPQLGFGLWEVPKDMTGDVVQQALKTGYRLLDGAAIYGNEVGQGEGLRASGLPRDDVFVTTKVWNDNQGLDSTLRAIDASLDRLGMDAVDLCLIHWPCPEKGLYVDTWKAFIRAKEEGKLRSIGVSNFAPDHLERIIGETGVTPVLNQIELHPRFQQTELRAFHAEHAIITQSWTPLGKSKSFDDPVITSIADRLGKTPAQVILRWHVQLGCSVIPRSTNADRMAQNMALFDFELTTDDMAAIAGLDAGDRLGPDPATFA